MPTTLRPDGGGFPLRSKVESMIDAGSREAGKPGSREAGKPGSREAGKPGSREAGKPGSPEAAGGGHVR
ncbi:hypothetical protein [Saccharopolyspora spinosa]|uniref:hypothetical protein n=1 Tax=Saccharopolyspora spinosa TaxID=60894 RepID=UPI00117B8650